jgi:hypothetical protein
MMATMIKTTMMMIVMNDDDDVALGQARAFSIHRMLSLRSNLIVVAQQRCFQYTVPSSDDDDDDDKMLDPRNSPCCLQTLYDRV